MLFFSSFLLHIFAYICTDFQKLCANCVCKMNNYYHYSKDGVTVTAILDSRRLLVNGEYPVKIRVTYKRVRSYFPTGKTLKQEDWDRLSITRLQSLLSIRKDIENSFSVIRSAVEDLTNRGDFSIDMLNARLKMSSTMTLNAILQSKEEELRGDSKIGTADIFRGVLINMNRMSSREVALHDVTPIWLKSFENFLRKEDKAQTSIAIYLRAIRSIMNECRASGIIKESQYPFGRGKYEIQEGEGRKLALTLEQIGQIARYDDGLATTAKYRDYWLFLYLCNGINVADFVKLRYQDIVDGEISFVRQKTERRTRTRKEIHVPLTEPMKRIIEKYGNDPGTHELIFPILLGDEDEAKRKAKTKYFTRAINRRMAEIGAKLGIGNISTYTARHSFATVLKRSGANIAYISESLGHQNLKTTENYLASFEKEERRKNAELLTQF